jgi:hypothetical protein
MKTSSPAISFYIVVALLYFASARGAETLQISSAELAALHKAVGLTEHNGKLVDTCEQVVQPENEVIDLNGDGKPEVFVVISGTCYGAAGSQLSLFIKDGQGRWKDNFGFPSSGYRLLATRNKDYPDIEIAGPGVCLPIWRWNGVRYNAYKHCDSQR